MNQKFFIDIESNNEYINLIANFLYNELLNKGYDVKLLDNNIPLNDKIKEINNEAKESIVISNQINFNNEVGSEIIYALKDTNMLANSLQNTLGNYTNIAKFYQLRLPSNTALDYYQIIRETPDAETIIISYNENDLSEMQNNWQDIAQALLDGLLDYLTKQNVYVVVSGDSLYSIAQKFGVTIQEIIDTNNLGNNTNLSIGQELIIPDKKEETPPIQEEIPNTYTVKSGDSLYSIARRFNTSVDILKSLNNLTSNTLSIGKVLLLPVEKEEPETSTTYIVQSGDSLYSIARRFNTSVDAIKSLNNLTSNTLSIGQTLRIPSDNTSTKPNTTNYTVKSGDSLYSIARRFNTSVVAIKSLNNLTSNTLSIGQTLRIPSDNTSTQPSTTNYTVQSGDSLYSIARRFNTSVDTLKNLNNLTSNILSIGQVLRIPTV